MDVSEAIRKRRSIKRYLDIPIEWEKIGSILDSGRLAPSAGNLQPWKFLVVTNPEGRKKIAESCFQQYWMQSAPVHIIICAELNKMNRFYGVRGERLYSVQSCAVAAENMLLEAVNQGLAGSFISAFDEEMIKRHFKMPDFARPQVVLTIGFAGEEVPSPPKYTLNDVVHVESYGSKMTDVMGFFGYGSGRTIKNVVSKGKVMFDKLAQKGEKAIKEKINGMKINKEKNSNEDFFYRS